MKALVFGISPLPFENRKQFGAVCLRTWQICKILVENNHNVLLTAFRLPEDSEKRGEQRVNIEGFRYIAIDEPERFFDVPYLQSIHDEFNPDVIIGANSLPAAQACRLSSNAPIWSDLNGHVMTEAQLHAKSGNDDSLLSIYLEREKTIIKRTDIFSVVTKPQFYALIGELGLESRLNKDTINYDFIRYMPVCVSEEPQKLGLPVLREKGIAEEDFVVLWSGGFNLWTDIDLLYNGLTAAMTENSRIKFISTGGSVSCLSSEPYKTFREKVSKSEFSNRFIFCDWVKMEELGDFYDQSHLGLNIDGDNYEIMLGCRYRLIAMLTAGLPILTTRGTETAQLIEDNKLGFVIDIGNVDELKNKILFAVDHPEALRRFSQKGKEFAFGELYYKKVMKPLVDWLESPRHSPDWEKQTYDFKQEKNNRENLSFIEKFKKLFIL